MSTFVVALLIGLIGVMTHLESRMMGECKLSMPLVTGVLVGLVLGDVKNGAILGAQFQLLWMGVAGIGATPNIDIGVGSTLGAAFAILTNSGFEVALALAIPIAVLVQYLNVIVRTILNGFMAKADAYAIAGDVKGMTRIQIFGLFLFSMLGFIPCFSGIMFGQTAMAAFVESIPTWGFTGLTAASKLFTALGFALLLQVMYSKDLVPYLILGFVLAAFLGLNSTAIALIAVVIAIVIFQTEKSKTGSPSDMLEEDIL